MALHIRLNNSKLSWRAEYKKKQAWLRIILNGVDCPSAARGNFAMQIRLPTFSKYGKSGDKTSKVFLFFWTDRKNQNDPKRLWRQLKNVGYIHKQKDSASVVLKVRGLFKKFCYERHSILKNKVFLSDFVHKYSSLFHTCTGEISKESSKNQYSYWHLNWPQSYTLAYIWRWLGGKRWTRRC